MMLLGILFPSILCSDSIAKLCLEPRVVIKVKSFVYGILICAFVSRNHLEELEHF